jgi:CrcB protein
MSSFSPAAFALVAIGGAVGSVLRHAVSLLAGAMFGLGFPWGTLAVNLIGSAAIGVLAGIGVSDGMRLLLATGMLGGFTTFSAFSLETGQLLDRSPALAALYVAASVALGVAAFVLCFWFARRV